MRRRDCSLAGYDRALATVDLGMALAESDRSIEADNVLNPRRLGKLLRAVPDPCQNGWWAKVSGGQN
ncbi:hypothetical protein OG500_19010 [Kitasatospora sp. NBC_01250]|uniref:hypothetical protein n=1 Tax=Kitasatospora sp. NBC_01250 TaxID=2903571 RepID=UPI002E34A76F|nr:hypothetical protein [Kitasatospora sp. NBC_01250]